MNLSISIDMTGAAFEGITTSEVVRLLRKATDRLETHGLHEFPLVDINGNVVGEVTNTDD